MKDRKKVSPMCTTILYTSDHRYLLRNFDNDQSYNETVTTLTTQTYNIIGMATILEDTPLFYDAINQEGLAMAALNFPGNAHYFSPQPNKKNVPSYALITDLLGNCATIQEAQDYLAQLNITNTPFSKQVPPEPLHWMLTDGHKTIVIESMEDGLHTYENPYHVLTNNPPFPYQAFNMAHYQHLDVTSEPNDYCVGLGLRQLPGDPSSMSRFVKANFLREHATTQPTTLACVNQAFHILSAVEMIEGTVQTQEGTWDKTIYSACIDLDTCTYYYTTYQDRTIRLKQLKKG